MGEGDIEHLRFLYVNFEVRDYRKLREGSKESCQGDVGLEACCPQPPSVPGARKYQNPHIEGSALTVQRNGSKDNTVKSGESGHTRHAPFLICKGAERRPLTLT